MGKLTKKSKLIAEKVTPGKVYALADAMSILREFSSKKFKEGVDISVKLGIRKSDQGLRGAVSLPHGTGKTVRVAVFTGGDQVEAAKAAGADKVGMDDLAAEIKSGQINYDVIIASPDAMRVVGQLGQILGPRGLMPNPKLGTATADVAQAVTNAKAGQARFRAEKAGIVHCSIGKIDFSDTAIKENLEAVLVALKKIKPPASKGVYLKKLTLSTTMGPGLAVDLSGLELS